MDGKPSLGRGLACNVAPCPCSLEDDHEGLGLVPWQGLTRQHPWCSQASCMVQKVECLHCQACPGCARSTDPLDCCRLNIAFERAGLPRVSPDTPHTFWLSPKAQHPMKVCGP